MWHEYLNGKNKVCYQKSLIDGLYTGEYVESEMKMTLVGLRPIQHIVKCMRCGVVIADRRGTPFHGGGVVTHLTEEDELKAFPLMRKVQIRLKGVVDGMKVMLCEKCVVPVLSHENDERLMFVFVSGHAIFFEQCQYNSKFIRKQVKDLESFEVEK